MPPTVAEAINHGRRAIRELEPDILARLLREYEQVWRNSERRIMQFEAQIAAAQRAGETVRPSWVRQQVWYRQLQASIDDEFVGFNRQALSTIGAGQSQAVGIAGQSTTMFRQAVGVQTSLGGRVNAGAFERWVSATQPGSPIRGVIERYGPRLERVIAEKISEGIGGGQGVSGIIRNIEQVVGTDAVGGRLQSTIRHEMLRAYRGASKDQYDAMPDDLIESYRWLASLSTRTCAICWALHGTLSPAYRMDQHIACRCVQVPVVSPKYVPPRQPGMTGEERFARLSVSEQRKIMPSNLHFEAYQNGMPLSAIVGTKQSRVWGPSIVIKPAYALPGARP